MAKKKVCARISAGSRLPGKLHGFGASISSSRTIGASWTFAATNEQGLERDHVDLSGPIFHASKQSVAALPILRFIRSRRVPVVQSVSGPTGERDLSAAGCSETEHPRDQGLPCPLGGVLPPGLVRDDCFLACLGAEGASVAAGFAAVSKCRLVVWRFTGTWRARYEQLSADDRHQPSQEPDEGVWMVRSDAELQHLRAS